MAGRIEIERDDRGVETIWLNNQNHRNTLNNSLIDDMAAAIHRSNSDDQCRHFLNPGNLSQATDAQRSTVFMSQANHSCG